MILRMAGNIAGSLADGRCAETVAKDAVHLARTIIEEVDSAATETVTVEDLTGHLRAFEEAEAEIRRLRARTSQLEAAHNMLANVVNAASLLVSARDTLAERHGLAAAMRVANGVEYDLLETTVRKFRGSKP